MTQGEYSTSKMASETGQVCGGKNSLKRKAENQMIFCSVCSIVLNSSSQANAHFVGKSHKNKTQGLNLEGGWSLDCNTPTPVSSNPQHFHCDVCQKSFNSALQLKDHLHGKYHQQAAQSKLENSSMTFNGNFSPNASTNVIMTPGTSNPGSMTPGVFTPGISTPAIETERISNHETSHDVICSEAAVLQQGTDKLVEQVDEPATVGKNLTNLFRCEMCNIMLNSVRQLNQHCKGMRHKVMIGEAKPPSVNGEKWENVRFMKISNAILGINKDTSTGSGGGMNLREFHCEKCNITVNSQTQLDQHLQSIKHKDRKPTPPSNPQNSPRNRNVGQHVQSNIHSHRTNVLKPLKPLSASFVSSNSFIPAGGGIPVLRPPPGQNPYYTQNDAFPRGRGNL